MTTRSPRKLIERLHAAILDELEDYTGPRTSGDLAELVGSASTLAIAEVTIKRQMKLFTRISDSAKVGHPVEIFRPDGSARGFLALVKGKHFDRNGLFIPTFIVKDLIAGASSLSIE